MTDDGGVIDLKGARTVLAVFGFLWAITGFLILVAPGAQVKQNHRVDELSDDGRAQLERVYRFFGWGGPFFGGMGLLGVFFGSAVEEDGNVQVLDGSIWDVFHLVMGICWLLPAVSSVVFNFTTDIMDKMHFKPPMFGFFMVQTIALAICHFLACDFSCFNQRYSGNDDVCIPDPPLGKTENLKNLSLVMMIFMIMQFLQSLTAKKSFNMYTSFEDNASEDEKEVTYPFIFFQNGGNSMVMFAVYLGAYLDQDNGTGFNHLMLMLGVTSAVFFAIWFPLNIFVFNTYDKLKMSKLGVGIFMVLFVVDTIVPFLAVDFDFPSRNDAIAFSAAAASGSGTGLGRA